MWVFSGRVYSWPDLEDSVSLLEMIEVKPTRAKVPFVDHLIHRSPRGTMIHSYCLLILN